MFQVCRKLGIKHILIQAEAHKEAGRIERYHATLEDKLRKLIAKRYLTIHQWNMVLQESVRLIRVTPLRTTQSVHAKILTKMDEQGNALPY